MKYRFGEKPRTRFRSKRYFLVGDQYYFSTREGMDIGPFDSKPELYQAIEYFKEIRVSWDKQALLAS